MGMKVETLIWTTETVGGQVKGDGYARNSLPEANATLISFIIETTKIIHIMGSLVSSNSIAEKILV